MANISNNNGQKDKNKSNTQSDTNDSEIDPDYSAIVQNELKTQKDPKKSYIIAKPFPK